MFYQGGFVASLKLTVKPNIQVASWDDAIRISPPPPSQPEQTLLTKSREVYEALGAVVSEPLTLLQDALDSISRSATPEFSSAAVVQPPTITPISTESTPNVSDPDSSITESSSNPEHTPPPPVYSGKGAFPWK